MRLLFEGVHASLRSPGPLLCDLSGGYDSSSVFAIAARLIERGESPGPILGWSLTSDRSNEGQFQDAVRQQYPFQSHTLDMSTCPPFTVFTDCEIPSGGLLQMGATNRRLREFAKTEGVMSHITGDGADSLFNKRGGGPPVYLGDLFRQGRFVQWAHDFAAHLKNGSNSAWQLIRHCTIGSLDPHLGRRAPIPSWITPKFRKEIAEAKHDFLYQRERAFKSHARERMYRFTMCFVPNNFQGLPDQRLPLLHRPLVEFVLGLDWSFMVRPNEERVLMRRSLQGILPPAVLSGECRATMGATVHESLRLAWPKISEILTGPHLADLGVVEQRPFQDAVRAMRAGYEGPNPQITRTALYLETWMGLKSLLARAGHYPQTK